MGQFGLGGPVIADDPDGTQEAILQGTGVLEAALALENTSDTRLDPLKKFLPLRGFYFYRSAGKPDRTVDQSANGQVLNIYIGIPGVPTPARMFFGLLGVLEDLSGINVEMQ